MMKRLICLAMTLCLLLGALPAAVAEDTPTPIDLVPYDQLPATIDGQHHYLLLCVDNWHGNPNNLGWTDGIVMVTLDTRTHRVMLTSLIREALVQRPDGKIGRINGIAKNYGVEAFCKVISEHIGVKVEKFILFDFSQIQEIIDFLGGVDITITDAEASYLKRYAINDNATTPVIRGAGTYHFNGHAAVIFMRIRKVGGGGDLMRTQRVRTVLSTLTDQCREITYDNALALVDSVMQNTTITNMNTDDMVEAMNYAYGMRDCTVEELRIPQDGTSKSITYAGMSVHDVDWAVNRIAMQNFLESSFLVLDDE